ncbi:MAG: DEAD/DEAH box helicase family protein [Candidatus Scalinduaceae bacterium]
MNVINILRKCNSWQDFKAYVQPLSKKQKGDCFETLTKNFLQLHPKYSTQLKNVWFLSEVPSRVRKRLNIPGTDEGIDLIAETKDDAYWAIQCKYRENEDKSLTNRELSTFTSLAFSISKKIELGLVCTSADRFSHKLTMYGERLSFCAGDIWRGLEKEFFSRLHNYLDHKVISLNPLKPREHQKKAIQQAYQYFIKQKNSRGKLIQPCGTGKTLTGYWLAQKLKARTILLAVPSLCLIRQTLEVWTREAVANQQDINWIVVCSDETVGYFEREDVAVLTQDLGVRIHTDSGEIAQWLNEQKSNTTVVFTTYQSSRSTSEAARRAGIVFDIGIMDEAHKTVGKKDSLFSHILYDENIRIKKRIFMTATERRYMGKSDQIASMDNPELYGETFELLSFKKALESRPAILSDYKIVTIQVTRSEIARLIKCNMFVKPDRGKWDGNVEAEIFAAIIALRKAMQKHPIRHIISFHNSIARAKVFKINQENFNSTFPEYGELDTFHVSGKTPTAVRSRQIDTFEAAKRGLITNARCLTEGVDVPNIDCILFADPKKSAIDIVQAVGRALRPAVGKKYGYVVVPVLLDDEVTDRTSLQTKAFDAVLITLRALGANDERIIEYFRSVSQGRQWTRGTRPIEINIPEGVVVDAEGFINSVELQFWLRLAKLSWRPFEEAREFSRSLGLKSNSEWREYCKGKLSKTGTLPDDIPAKPERTYEDKGWNGWGDWLGTGTVAPRDRKYRSFKKARAFIHSLGLKSHIEWREYCKGKLSEKGKLPEDIPANPCGTYKGQGWKGWGNWLGTGTVATKKRKYRSFNKARSFVRSLGLKSNIEWRKYCKGELPENGMLPQDIPAKPDRSFKGQGWNGWGDWLGTGIVAPKDRKFCSFKEARVFVHTLGLKNRTEWRKYCKGELLEKGTLPDDIPTRPDRTYKDSGWSGMGDWLGTDR